VDRESTEQWNATQKETRVIMILLRLRTLFPKPANVRLQ
jgi:hypothetical protein